MRAHSQINGPKFASKALFACGKPAHLYSYEWITAVRPQRLFGTLNGFIIIDREPNNDESETHEKPG